MNRPKPSILNPQSLCLYSGNEQAIAPEEGGEVLYGPYGIDRVEVEVEEEDREGEMRVRRRSVRLDQVTLETLETL